MSAVMQDNLAGQLTILKSQLQELAISIGDSLMPIIRDIVSKIQEWVDMECSEKSQKNQVRSD